MKKLLVILVALTVALTAGARIKGYVHKSINNPKAAEKEAVVYKYNLDPSLVGKRIAGYEIDSTTMEFINITGWIALSHGFGFHKTAEQVNGVWITTATVLDSVSYTGTDEELSHCGDMWCIANGKHLYPNGCGLFYEKVHEVVGDKISVGIRVK